MSSDVGPKRRPDEQDHDTPRLLRSRWAIPTFIFVVCVVATAATGYIVGLSRHLDLTYLAILRLHTQVGVLGLVGLAVLSAAHLRVLYGRAGLWVAVLVNLIFVGIAMSDLGPVERIGIPMAILMFCTVRYLLPRRRTAAWIVWLGVTTFLALWIVYGTGWSIAGPTRMQRTNLAARLHDTAGWLALPIILLHFAWGFPFRTDGRTRKALVILVATLVISIAHAMRQPAFEIEAAVLAGREEAIPDRIVTDGRTCGAAGCHSEIWKQWEVSAHRFSGVNLPYTRVAELFERERGLEGQKTCRGCHEPNVPSARLDAVWDGAVEDASPNEGVTCRGCHLIDSVHEPVWNGQYTLAPETLYLPGRDLANSHMRAVYDELIRLQPRDHRANFARAVQARPELCETCHRLAIPAEWNGAKPFVFDGPVPSWRDSSYATDGVGCNACHLQLFEFPDPDSAERDYHARPDHRFFGLHAYLGETIATSDVVPQRWDAFRDATRAWLAGTLKVSPFEQTFLYYTGDPRSRAYRAFSGKPALALAFAAHADGDAAILRVLTTNQRIGHRFPVSLVDMCEVWLELTVEGPNGEDLYSSGLLDGSGRIPPDAHRLGARIVDKEGNDVKLHRIWLASEIRGERFIYPGQVIEDEYRVPGGAATAGPLKISARWQYRRYDPEFTEWVWGAGRRAPALVIAEASVEVPLTDGGGG